MINTTLVFPVLHTVQVGLSAYALFHFHKAVTELNRPEAPSNKTAEDTSVVEDAPYKAKTTQIIGGLIVRLDTYSNGSNFATCCSPPNHLHLAHLTSPLTINSSSFLLQHPPP